MSDRELILKWLRKMTVAGKSVTVSREMALRIVQLLEDAERG